ncbi:hypothetical protein IAU60_004371 [Kwoniella sp. DSM 27419]
MDDLVSAATLAGPAIACGTAGAIVCLSYYSIPNIRSTSQLSTKIALHQLRSLFSSGSHVFPPLAMAASAAYGLCAYAIPQKRLGYIIAAAGSIGIAPFTTLVMVPAANGRLIKLDEKAKKGDFDGVKGSSEVESLLKSFEWLNGARGLIMAVGGLAGLYTALQ